MKHYIKDNKFFRNPLVVGDKQIVNPTHEQLIADGWQVYEPPTPSEADMRLAEIAELKVQLASTDYMVLKDWEAEKLGLPLPYTPEEIHAVKQPLRDRINQLESEVSDE